MRSRPAFFLFISLFCVFRLFPASIAACSSRSTPFYLFCRVSLTEHAFLLILCRLPRVPLGARLFTYFAACPSRNTPFYLFCVGCRVSHGARLFAYFAACSSRSTPFCLFCRVPHGARLFYFILRRRRRFLRPSPLFSLSGFSKDCSCRSLS